MLSKNFDFDFVVFVKLNLGNKERTLVSGEPEFYVFKKSEARKLVHDLDKKWPFIPYNEKTFKNHRGGWGIIKEFLEISGNCSPLHAQAAIGMGFPASVRRMASRARSERRRAVSTTERMSA